MSFRKRSASVVAIGAELFDVNAKSNFSTIVLRHGDNHARLSRFVLKFTHKELEASFQMHLLEGALTRNRFVLFVYGSILVMLFFLLPDVGAVITLVLGLFMFAIAASTYKWKSEWFLKAISFLSACLVDLNDVGLYQWEQSVFDTAYYSLLDLRKAAKTSDMQKLGSGE